MAKIYRVIQIKLNQLKKMSIWPYDHWLANNAYLSAISQWQTFIRVFTYKMAAKINWRRYGTKLRHCEPMYTAVQCGLDPATQISSTSNFIVQCAWFQADCNPRSSHGCQCSAVLHLILCVVKRQLTMCFKSSKAIYIGLCMLMSLSIHLHGLHLDAQHGQTWHLSTQLRSGQRTGRRLLCSTTLLLPTLQSYSQVSISVVIYGLWWTVSGQVRAHVVLTCTNMVSPNHLPVIVASDRRWTTLSTRAH